MADQDDLIISISTDLTSVKRQLNKLVGDVDSATRDISRKWDTAGKSMDKSMTTALQSRIDSMVGIGKQATQEWNGALADQGKQLDALRAKYNPLFATIKQYQAAQTNIKTLYRSGTIGLDEYTAAMARERQATLASISALKSRNAIVERSPVSSTSSTTSASGRPWQTGNIVAQLQDIGVGAQGGQKPLTIALQQGTQLADVLQTFGNGKSAIAGVSAAFASLVNPVQLVTIGLVAGGAALFQYFADAKDNTKKVDDLLKAHSATIATIKDRYGEAAAGVQEYAKDSEAVTLSQARQNLKDAYAAVGKQASNLASGGPALSTALAPDLKDLPDLATKLQRAFIALGASVRSGKPDLLAFQDSLAQIGNDEKTPEAVREAIRNFGELDEKTKKVAASIPGMVDALKAIGGAAGDQIDRVAQLSAELKKLSDMAAPGQTVGEQISSTVNSGLSKLREFSGGGTLDEDARRRLIIAGQRAQQAEDNKYVDMGDGTRVAAPTPAPRPNVELEGLPGEVEKQEAAAKKAADAADALKKKQEDLMRTAGDRIAQTQQEIDLTGKYGVAAEKARFALEEWQKAEKLNLSDDQKKALQEKIDQYGQLADALAKVKLSQDLSDKARMRTLSPQDQQISTQLRQYGLPDDLNSPQAQQIRKSMQVDAADDAVKGFLTNFRDDVVKDGGSIGKAFGQAVETTFLDALTKAGDAAIQRVATSLVNAFLGTSGTGAGAATGGAAAGVVGKIFGGGTSAAPVTAVTRAALPAVTSAPATDIASYIAKAATARGIDPSTALAVAKSEGGLSSWNLQSNYVKNGVQEQSFGPFQLYKGGGLGNLFQKQTGLDPANASSGPAGVDFALDYAKKNGWSSWYGAKNSGISNWQGIGSGGSMNSAADAVNKLAENSKAAATSVGGFGTNLSQLSSSFFPSAPQAASGGGGLSWLSSLFGGAFKPIGAQASLAASGSISGLFADGGHISGPGGPRGDKIPIMASDGEFMVNATATKKHRALLESINNGRPVGHFADGGLVSSRVVQAPAGPSLQRPQVSGSNGGQPGVLQVHINGANGDDHVRQLVKQGVGEGLQSYNDNQVRGGFGTNQNRWNARKG